MEIKVKVIPNSSKQEVKPEKGILKVYLNSPPAEGRANKELIEVLAKHFKIKKSKVLSFDLQFCVLTFDF